MRALEFENEQQVRSYYNSRYEANYMDEWDVGKIMMVKDILLSLRVSPGSRILDYGCGTGFFTDLIRRFSMRVEVVGADISEAAVTKARKRLPQISFMVLNRDTMDPASQLFDIIFTHHVLEHVFDLRRTIEDIRSRLAPGGCIVHILPCANEGSLEYRICACYPDGIEKERGNRFFCEDPSHLRRLTSNDLIALHAAEGLTVEKEFYANQFWGAVRLISEANPKYIAELLDPRRALPDRRSFVLLWRTAMVSLFWLRFAARMNFRKKFDLSRQSWRQVVAGFGIGTLGLLCWPASRLIDWIVCFLSSWEWRRRNADRAGSEMALVFRDAR